MNIDDYVSLIKKRNLKKRIKEIMPKKFEASLNDYMIIYPSNKGWDMIDDVLRQEYALSLQDRRYWIDRKKTEDGGYREQIWVIASDFGSFLTNGSTMLEKTKIVIFAE
jgi:hypothetical protein